MNDSLPAQFEPMVEKPLAMLRACPAYEPTPLVAIAPFNSVNILVKDETDRMGLGAFKALGGVYAVGRYMIEQWREQFDADLAPEQLAEELVKDWARDLTFVCASAGNHGMAVAKGAQLFNAKCRVYLAKTVPDSFVRRLKELGAEVVTSGQTYEEAMQAAREDSEKEDTILLADTAWPGYHYLPSLVMEGYTVMAEEIRLELAASDVWPTHVFLQAGVGGMAAAMSYEIRNKWPEQPRIIVVEPEVAPCLQQSHLKGKPTTVSGGVTSMGRIDCKIPSDLAFQTLTKLVDDFVCVSDADAQHAVDYLKEDGIGTTPSGAAGMAAVLIARDLDLDLAPGACALVIATEGSID